MYITELNEPQLLVIYPGRFQPFHKGHAKVFNYLTTKFGRNNVYIATSNKVEPPKSPFTFSEKAYFMQLTGVPADRIIQCDQPYKTENLVNTGRITIADQANTVIIFAVSQKDMEEDPRFKSWTKKDGSPAYFQPMPKNIKETEGMNHHGYIMVVPTFDFTVMGQPMQSGTELRQMYVDADEQQRQAIIKDLFGKYTREAEQLMTNKLVPVEPKAQPTAVKLPKTMKPAGGLEPVNEAGGVGVVKSGNDPRYSMSTAGDQNAVTGDTLGKEMKAFGLVGRKNPGKTRQRPVTGGIGKGALNLKEADIAEDLAWVKSKLGEGAVDELTARHIQYINQDIDELKQRIATESLPAHYVEKLKQKIAQLETERAKLAF